MPSSNARSAAAIAVASAGSVLDTPHVELPVGASDLLAARTEARARHDWAAADRLRDDLQALGVRVIDRADGTTEARRID